MAEAEKKVNEQDVEEAAKTEAENAEEAAAEMNEEETAEAEADQAGESEEPGAEAQAEEKAPEGKNKAMQDKVAALEDKVKRQMAEFDNFRKRTAKEKEQMFSMGERNVIEKMLPVVDNFERGLAAVPEEEKESPLASGMEMIYKQLFKQLEDLGVKPIEAVGKEFDPNYHNAVMQVESDEYESGVVAQEFLKGYTYHDTVIRHSMVGVVQ
jgi:molecular chaperone GrpE